MGRRDRPGQAGMGHDREPGRLRLRDQGIGRDHTQRGIRGKCPRQAMGLEVLGRADESAPHGIAGAGQYLPSADIQDVAERVGHEQRPHGDAAGDPGAARAHTGLHCASYAEELPHRRAGAGPHAPLRDRPRRSDPRRGFPHPRVGPNVWAAETEIVDDRSRHDRDSRVGRLVPHSTGLEMPHDTVRSRQPERAPPTQDDGVHDVDRILGTQQVGLAGPRGAAHHGRPSHRPLCADHHCAPGEVIEVGRVADQEAGHVGNHGPASRIRMSPATTRRTVPSSSRIKSAPASSMSKAVP
jgi:hypothetical protein